MTLLRTAPLLVLLSILPFQVASAQPGASPPWALSEAAKPKSWYDRISLRGYSQLRYNQLLATNPALRCDQCDKSWGGGNSFFVRRARLIFFGDVHERVYIYIQPDLASAATDLHYAQVRDLYFDLALDARKEFRLRFGQSKVPYGFESLQSSQNRLALDRNDALNSAVPNERDLGLLFYWATAEARKRFSHLVNSGLKGSGDYGILGIGLMNGQAANKAEANNNRMIVARLAYPAELPGGQVIEGGIQGYAQEYTLQKSSGVAGPRIAPDRRVAASFIYYPQPLGFQAEYTVGEGPAYNRFTNSVEVSGLSGGYVQVMARTEPGGAQVLMPFARYQYFNGGKKFEIDARRYLVRDLELGLEWQPFPAFELTTIYTISSRLTQDSKVRFNDQSGNLLRIQAQFNY